MDGRLGRPLARKAWGSACPSPPATASLAFAGLFLRICPCCVWPYGVELPVLSPLGTAGHGPFPLTFVLFCILEIAFRAVCFGQKVIGKSVPYLAHNNNTDVHDNSVNVCVVGYDLLCTIFFFPKN